MTNRKWLAGITLVVGASLGFGVGALRAAGVPQTQPLFYSGTITESGVPASGARNVRVSLWNDATKTATANRKCETVANNTEVDNGRFRVELDAECVSAVHANPELWVEVLVGDTALPRAKVGAVPFALEADRASAAVGALDQRIATLETRSGFRAHMGANQPDIPASSHNKVTFDTEDWDSNTEYDVATSTFTPKVSGTYLIQCSIIFQTYTAGTSGWYESGIVVNGTNIAENGHLGDGWSAYRNVSTLARLQVGDDVTCDAYQESGSTPDLQADPRTSFEAIWISP